MNMSTLAAMISLMTMASAVAPLRVTVSRHSARLLLPSVVVAEMVAAPSFSVVICPLASTVATLSSVEAHVSFL